MKVVEFAFVAYPVTDLARARAFYENVLGFSQGNKPSAPDSPWIEYEVGPHTLGIGSHPSMKPSSDGPSLGLEVDDFDAAIAQLKTHHVHFQMEPIQTPVCRMAVILDPDGNKLVIHKRNAG